MDHAIRRFLPHRQGQARTRFEEKPMRRLTLFATCAAGLALCGAAYAAPIVVTLPNQLCNYGTVASCMKATSVRLIDQAMTEQTGRKWSQPLTCVSRGTYKVVWNCSIGKTGHATVTYQHGGSIWVARIEITSSA
jgi:hypothetical protein